MKKAIIAAASAFLVLLIAAVWIIPRRQGSDFTAEGNAQENKSDEIPLTILNYWGETDTDQSSVYFRKIMQEEFPEKFPNIRLTLTASDNGTYKQKIRVLMACDDTPDIMMSYGGGFSKAFVEKGKVLCLDDYLTDFTKSHMKEKMQENFVYGGKHYGLGYSYWTGVLYCNKKLFQKVGADIPQTYDELVDVCRTFRAEGIDPIALGMLDKWHGQQWINNFTIQLSGADLYKKMASGEVSVDNEVLEQAVSLVKQLVDIGAFSSDREKIASSEAEEDFLNGKAAMIYIGDWYNSSAQERMGGSVTVTRMPRVPGAAYEEDFHGGSINCWMVSSSTSYPEQAAEVVQWLSYRLACYQSDHSAFQVDAEDVYGTESTLDRQVANLYSEDGECGCAWDTLMTPDQAEAWLEECGLLYDQKMSAGGFVKSLYSKITWGN